MKNRMKFVGLVLLSIAMLIGCKENTEQEAMKPKEPEQGKGWKEFKSDSLHFSIAFPPGWEARLNGSKVGIFELKKDTNDLFEDNIIIWMEEMPVAIPDSLYAVASVTEFKIKNPGIEPSVLPVRQLGGITYHAFTFDFENKKKETFSILGLTRVAGNRGYNFSCTALKNELTIHEPSFDSILATFKPL